MAAERMLVFAHITTTGENAREEFLGHLKKLAEIAEESEPGVLKYAGLVPREDDGKTFYMIEEYLDKAAFDQHMATDGVKAIVQLLQSGKGVDPSTPPILYNLEYLPNFRFSRTKILSHPDPYVVFGALDYVPGGVEKSIPYWKEVVETGRNDEPGTLMYGIAKDPSNDKRLCAIEGYESAEYLKEVHVPSKAIQESIANTKHLRTGLKHHFMKKRFGYLHKDV